VSRCLGPTGESRYDAKVSHTKHPETFTAPDGVELHANWYLPDGEPKAGLLIVHGYADHGARYAHVAARFTALGYAVLAPDYRGHGRAEGKRGHCDRFDEFVFDVEAAANLLRGALGELPLGVYAHSHGALITLVALTNRHKLAGARAVAFTNPFLAIGSMKVNRALLALTRPVSWIYPRLTQPHGIPAAGLTRDAAMLASAARDPLRHNDATAGWSVASRDAQAQVIRDIGRIQLPTLWQLGTGDPIANPRLTLELYASVPEPKALKTYEGLLHELVNEIERERVLDDMVEWFERVLFERA
jgi:alpha-beta hydrolase superfamily lysophospholipase